jgi:hypothetical protein
LLGSSQISFPLFLNNTPPISSNSKKEYYHNSIDRMIAMKKWQLMLLLLTVPVTVNAQTDDTGCDFCADGSAFDPAFSDVDIEVFGTPTTCGEYSDELAETPSFFCSVDHEATGSFCGCPAPIPCSFCANGSDFDAAFADVVLETNEYTGEDETCANYAISVPESITQNNMECPLTQIQGFISCGCPTAPEAPGPGSCPFCADGSGLKDEFADTEVIVNEETGETATCGQLALAFPFFEDEFSCVFTQFAFSAQCGCSSELGACSFCADGSDPAEGFEDVVALTDDEDGSETTCADLAFGLPFLPVDDDFPAICSGVQFATYTSCGCAALPESTGSCSFCADGSELPESFKDVLVTVDDYGTEITCAQFAAGTFFLPEDDIETCAGVQFLASTSCGCPAPTGGCTLCADGSAVPDESLELFPDSTCGELSFQANFIDADECSALQVTAGIYCGCDSTVENVCRVCGGTQLLPEVGRPIIFEGEEEVCGYAEFMANTMPEMCSSMQETYGPQCCFTEVSANSTTTIPSNTTSKAPTKMPSKAPTSTTATGVTTPTPSPSSGANMVKVELPIFVVIIAAFFSF